MTLARHDHIAGGKVGAYPQRISPGSKPDTRSPGRTGRHYSGVRQSPGKGIWSPTVATLDAIAEGLEVQAVTELRAVVRVISEPQDYACNMDRYRFEIDGVALQQARSVIGLNHEQAAERPEISSGYWNLAERNLLGLLSQKAVNRFAKTVGVKPSEISSVARASASRGSTQHGPLDR